MAAAVQHSSSLAGRLAEDLLRAWISGDMDKVSEELERSSSIPTGASDTGEQERRHLLRAVAERMRNCPDLLEEQGGNPVVELCVHLLGHLVSLN